MCSSPDDVGMDLTKWLVSTLDTTWMAVTTFDNTVCLSHTWERSMTTETDETSSPNEANKTCSNKEER